MYYEVCSLLEESGLSPDSRLTQTRAIDTFQLEFSELCDLPCEAQQNPRSPSFPPMKLYSAYDVA